MRLISPRLQTHNLSTLSRSDALKELLTYSKFKGALVYTPANGEGHVLVLQMHRSTRIAQPASLNPLSCLHRGAETLDAWSPDDENPNADYGMRHAGSKEVREIVGERQHILLRVLSVSGGLLLPRPLACDPPRLFAPPPSFLQSVLHVHEKTKIGLETPAKRWNGAGGGFGGDGAKGSHWQDYSDRPIFFLTPDDRDLILTVSVFEMKEEEEGMYA